MSFTRGEEKSDVMRPVGWPSVPDGPKPKRLDVHNASVDEVLAGDGICAPIHLASGRVCLLAHNHGGPCEFVTTSQP